MTTDTLPEQFRQPFAESYFIRKDQHDKMDAYFDRLLEASDDARARYFRTDFSSVDAYEASVEPMREEFLSILSRPKPV